MKKMAISMLLLLSVNAYAQQSQVLCPTVNELTQANFSDVSKQMRVLGWYQDPNISDPHARSLWYMETAPIKLSHADDVLTAANAALHQGNLSCLHAVPEKIEYSSSLRCDYKIKIQEMSQQKEYDLVLVN